VKSASLGDSGDLKREAGPDASGRRFSVGFARIWARLAKSFPHSVGRITDKAETPALRYNPDAVTNRLNFCMAATSITWISGAHLEHTPPRRYSTTKRTEYAFADLRRRLAQDHGGEGFRIDYGGANKPTQNPLIAAFMRLVAQLKTGNFR
jgi:hypothetical protein